MRRSVRDTTEIFIAGLAVGAQRIVFFIHATMFCGAEILRAGHRVVALDWLTRARVVDAEVGRADISIVAVIGVATRPDDVPVFVDMLLNRAAADRDGVEVGRVARWEVTDLDPLVAGLLGLRRGRKCPETKKKCTRNRYG